MGAAAALVNDINPSSISYIHFMCSCNKCE